MVSVIFLCTSIWMPTLHLVVWQSSCLKNTFHIRICSLHWPLIFGCLGDPWLEMVRFFSYGLGDGNWFSKSRPRLLFFVCFRLRILFLHFWWSDPKSGSQRRYVSEESLSKENLKVYISYDNDSAWWAVVIKVQWYQRKTAPFLAAGYLLMTLELLWRWPQFSLRQTLEQLNTVPVWYYTVVIWIFSNLLLT